MTETKQNILPEGWITTEIKELCALVNGRAFKPSEWSTEGTPIIRIQNLNNPDASYNHYRGEIDNKFHVAPRELLFAWSGTPGTSFGAHIWNGPKAYLNQHIFRVLFDETKINKTYFRYALNERLTNIIDRAHGGVGLRHITKKKFEETKIFLPPFSEQKRIADKIDLLQVKSKKAREALEAARPLLDKLRQSVLASAFRGDLTADWRAKNPDVEPASALLERIREERRRKWEEAELAKMRAKGKEPKNDKWKDRYKEPEPVDTTGLAELPEGWCWAKLDELGTWSGGGTPSKGVASYWENGYIPWITPKDMKKLFVSESIDNITEKAINESSTKIIMPGSILFVVRSGILRRVLPLCVNTVKTTVNQDLKALTPHSQLTTKHLLYSLLAVEEKIRHRCSKSGTTVESIDFPSLKDFPIPLPPHDEQQEVIPKIDRCLLSVEKNSESLESNERLLISLNQSILAKAFRGELVQQDPNDEPASVLLERIKAEREALKPKKKKATRKRKKMTT